MIHLFRHEMPRARIDMNVHLPAAKQYVQDQRPSVAHHVATSREHGVQYSIAPIHLTAAAENLTQTRIQTSFSQEILNGISKAGITNHEFYTRAALDRKLFSALKNGGAHYQPSRDTAIRCCLALHLSLERAEVLLRTAGFALSCNTQRDLLVRYCFAHAVWNVYDVDELLLAFGEKSLVP